jgi:peptide/nickel transport system ATP-binding protein
MNLLNIHKLNTYFPTPDGLVKAVDHVDLKIADSEKVGLIGETGCGKTVLGMSIVRLLDSSAQINGRIIYRGRDILELAEEDMRSLRGREIAMILQNPTTSLNPVMRVGDQIAEGIRLHGGLDKRAAKKRAVEILRAVMIHDAERRADQYPHEFSGGMKERAMIAIGLSCDPSIIIADEPTKGLDAKTKTQIVKLLKGVTEHKSMLMITHDLNVAASICDRVAVMYAGEILEVGKVWDVLKNPMHPYTRGFINSLPSRGLKPIRGSSPSLIDLPSGCRFCPRCDFAMEACKFKHPEITPADDGQSVRCFLYT